MEKSPTPRFRRDDYALMGYYLLTLIDGAVGFAKASPGVVHLFGEDGATWTFSFSLMVFGLTCFIARVSDNRRLEFSGLIGLIITTLVHGSSLVIFGGVQSGLRIFAGALMMSVYAYLRRGRADDAFWNAYDLAKSNRRRRQ